MHTSFSSAPAPAQRAVSLLETSSPPQGSPLQGLLEVKALAASGVILGEQG